MTGGGVGWTGSGPVGPLQRSVSLADPARLDKRGTRGRVPQPRRRSTR